MVCFTVSHHHSVLQRIQVLCEVYVLILQLISPLPDFVHSSVVLTQLVSNSRHSAVETMEASPGDGAGAEVEQLASDGGEGHLNALQILQQEQDAAVTHFTPHAVWAVCHRDLVVVHADVALLPRQPVGAGALPSAWIARAPSALTLSAAPLAEAPVAWGTLLAARAADAGQAVALACLCVTAAPHGTDITVTPPAARASLEAVVPLLAVVAVLPRHSSLAEALAGLWMA